MPSWKKIVSRHLWLCLKNLKANSDTTSHRMDLAALWTIVYKNKMGFNLVVAAHATLRH